MGLGEEAQTHSLASIAGRAARDEAKKLRDQRLTNLEEELVALNKKLKEDTR